jgi:hypothetical protein
MITYSIVYVKMDSGKIFFYKGYGMKKIPDKDRSEYYHRCYKAVDGLWFVKAEDKFNFEDALELDLGVWKVMPKIQARFIKKKLGKDSGLDDLMDCLSQKLLLDEFKFEVNKNKDNEKTIGIEFKISTCPWHDILIKSKREHFSDQIGGIICGEEYKVWAQEFGEDIRFSFGDTRICRGDACCVLTFNL